ncbi:MAG TPA: response regulator [Pilimelia sp.]|nr:response regulator [Pilimelia sp.]
MTLILVAEDEPPVREIIVRVLERAGHRVHPVADGESALRAVREHRPDLVLTDVDMPLINGFLLCDEIRRDPESANVPVVLVTGLVDPGDLRAVEVGASAVLAKPFTGPQLLAMVAEYLPAAGVAGHGGPRGAPGDG